MNSNLRKHLRVAGLVSTLLLAGAAQAAVTLYKQPNFRGGDMTLHGSTANLQGSGFYDNTSSIVVENGRWEFCSQPEFRGDCVTLGPGRYATLDRNLTNRIESVRPLQVRGDRDGDGRPDRWREHYGRNGSMELYGQPGFGGRSVEIDRDVASLRGSGMDDRASSIVVKEGIWQVCSAPGYGERAASSRRVATRSSSTAWTTRSRRRARSAATRAGKRYSTLMLASRMARAHLPASARWKSANWAGVVGMNLAPSVSSRFSISGERITF